MKMDSRPAGTFTTPLLSLALLLTLALSASVSAASPTVDRLRAIADGEHRGQGDRARDAHRHPVETLSWMGIREDMTVVEITPGAGWYTDILAPFLRDDGVYYAAGFDPESSVDFFRNAAQQFRQKIESAPALYGDVRFTILAPPARTEIAPAESVDLVLTFRNVHNWMSAGTTEAVFEAMYRALKPGGTLGLVEHRADPGAPEDPQARSGYVSEAQVIRFAEAAGFRFVDRTDINANPRDTRNHPKGVWTLPPTLRLGDQDRERYLAIGESDRMTLRFVKPVP